MLKKIIICLLVALPFFTVSEFDIEQFLVQKVHQTEKQEPNIHTPILTEGNRAVYIGMPYDDVLTVFGDPFDTQISEYGFVWNIFHENFKNYIQIGIQNERVVAIYTNSPRFSFCGISFGSSAHDTKLSFESPLDAIVKGNTKYVMSGMNETQTNMDLFLKDGLYVTYFYDVFKNNSVTAINIIEYDTEQGYRRLYGTPSLALKESFILQNFYVTNALRVREGLSTLRAYPELAHVANLHSDEMAEHTYFSHTDLLGGTVVERVRAAGIPFRSVGENIAMGAQNSLYMHELLMNSEGHRKNILGSFSAVGIGVSFSETDVPYLTQNFFR